MNDDIAAFVRNEYTSDGVEVEGEGANRIRLRMPPTFHNVTGLCRDLVEYFGAHIDLVIDHNDSTKCVVFEVYASSGVQSGADAPASVELETDDVPCGVRPALEATVVLAEPWTSWLMRNVVVPCFVALFASFVLTNFPVALTSALSNTTASHGSA